MPARFDKDRRRLAYLFGGSAVLAFGYLTITQPTLLGYGPTLAIGGFVAAAMALLGVNPTRRNGGAHEQAGTEKRKRPPRADDRLERRMARGTGHDHAWVFARGSPSFVHVLRVLGVGGGAYRQQFA